MLSLLRLNEVRIEKIVIKGRPVRAETPQGEHYVLTLDHAPLSLATGTWHQLRVRLNPAKGDTGEHSLDEVDVVVDGRFAIAEEAKDKVSDELYRTLAVSVLFGLARGIVAQSTGLFASGTFLLPPLDVTASGKRKRLSMECSLATGAQVTAQATLDEC